MKKWFLMLGYGIIVATSQMLWLTFSPITTNAAYIMNTSITNIGILSLVFPLVYIILAVPFSRWLDKAFIPAILTGVLLTGIGGVIRLAIPSNFIYQLICQVFISLGQPLLLGSLAIVPVYYFNEKERPLAISLGSLSLFIGIIVATAGGAFVFYRAGYTALLLVESIPGLLGILIVAMALKGTKVPSFVKKEERKFKLKKFHFMLAIMLFVGMGAYDALDTWLQPMISGYGFAADEGNIIGLMTFAGIIGAAVLPQIIAKRNYRRASILVIVAVSVLTFIFLAFVKNIFLIAGTFAIDGFFLLAGLPIIIEWAESATPASNQGQVTGLIMLFGNLGGLVLIFLDGFLLSYGNLIVVIIMSLFMVALIPVVLRMPSSAVGQKEVGTQ